MIGVTGKLENWVVTSRDSVYTAPELRRSCINGKIYNDIKGRFTDGEIITTGTIIKTEGRVVYTKRSSYELGKPLPLYLEWLVENGYEYNVEQPIKIE